MTTVKMVKLGTLIKPAKLQKCGNDNYPVLSMTMHNGLVFQSDKFKKSVASQDKSTYKVVHRNQLVIGFPIDEGVLATQRITDAGIVSPAYGIWDVDQTKIIPEFLEYALRCNRAIDYYKAKLRGSTARRRSLPTSTLLELDVPLPDIEQQKLALTTIHHAKNALDSRQAQLTKLDELIKARFVEMFGGYAPNAKLSDVASITGGLTKNSNRNIMKLKLPYLRVANVSYAKIDVSEMLEIGLTEDERAKTLLSYDDLLFVEGNGSPDQIGRVALWKNEITPCVHQNHLIKARFNSHLIAPYFALHYFMSREGREQIQGKAVSTSGLYTLSVSKISNLLIPTPPLSLQNQFADFVAEVDKSKLFVGSAVVHKPFDIEFFSKSTVHRPIKEV